MICTGACRSIYCDCQSAEVSRGSSLPATDPREELRPSSTPSLGAAGPIPPRFAATREHWHARLIRAPLHPRRPGSSAVATFLNHGDPQCEDHATHAPRASAALHGISRANRPHAPSPRPQENS